MCTDPQIAETNDIGGLGLDALSTTSTVTFHGVWVRNTGAPICIGDERDLGGKGLSAASFIDRSPRIRSTSTLLTLEFVMELAEELTGGRGDMCESCEAEGA